MPDRVRQVQDRDQIPPAAWRQRVEGRPGSRSFGVVQRDPAMLLMRTDRRAGPGMSPPACQTGPLAGEAPVALGPGARTRSTLVDAVDTAYTVLVVVLLVVLLVMAPMVRHALVRLAVKVRAATAEMLLLRLVGHALVRLVVEVRALPAEVLGLVEHTLVRLVVEVRALSAVRVILSDG